MGALNTVTTGCDPLPIGAHRKQGIDGSRLLGLRGKAADRAICCLQRRNLGSSRVRDGYILGLAGTRGTRDVSRPSAGRAQLTRSRPPRSQILGLARSAGVLRGDRAEHQRLARAGDTGEHRQPALRGGSFRSWFELTSPLSSRVRRSLPLRRRSTRSVRRRSATWRLRRGSPRR